MGKISEAISLLEKAVELIREEQTTEQRAERQICADRLGRVMNETTSAISMAKKHVEMKQIEGKAPQYYGSHVRDPYGRF